MSAFFRLPTTARRRPLSRAELEALIEGLIEHLDALDGDPDLEPTLGYLAPGQVDEAEGAYGRDEDSEPSLGWLKADDRDPTCRHANAADDDREQDDEREPDTVDGDAGEWSGEGPHVFGGSA